MSIISAYRQVLESSIQLDDQETRKRKLSMTTSQDDHVEKKERIELPVQQSIDQPEMHDESDKTKDEGTETIEISAAEPVNEVQQVAEIPKIDITIKPILDLSDILKID